MKKTPGDIVILHMCTKNYNQMVYSSWDIVRDRCNCYFSFWVISPFYPPKSQKNSKFSKNEKNSCRYHHFTYVHQKLWSNHLRFLRYPVQQTDRWTDRKSDTKRWVPHVKIRAASYIDPKGYLFSKKKKKKTQKSHHPLFKPVFKCSVSK